MDRRIKRFFRNEEGVRHNQVETGSQGQTVSEENEYAAPIYPLHLDLPLVSTLFLTLRRVGFKDEYGIKVLYHPDQPCAEYVLLYAHVESAKQSASIIFVHGLTGSQLSTWTAPGAPGPWPSLLLSDDIPNARISAFGYDADVVNFLKPAGQNKIRHNARNLLRGIADMWLETRLVSLSDTRD